MRDELTIEVHAVGRRRHVAVDVEERAFLDPVAGLYWPVPVRVPPASRLRSCRDVGHASQHVRRGFVVLVDQVAEHLDADGVRRRPEQRKSAAREALAAEIAELAVVEPAILERRAGPVGCVHL